MHCNKETVKKNTYSSELQHLVSLVLKIWITGSVGFTLSQNKFGLDMTLQSRYSRLNKQSASTNAEQSLTKHKTNKIEEKTFLFLNTGNTVVL